MGRQDGFERGRVRSREGGTKGGEGLVSGNRCERMRVGEQRVRADSTYKCLYQVLTFLCGFLASAPRQQTSS